MDAKYVITTTGHIAIFSKYLGMEHSQAAMLMDAEITDIAGAGFCSLVDDRLLTFGRSVSLGKSSRPEDAATLTSALLDGSLALVFDDYRLGYVATNTPDSFGSKESVCTPESIVASRIFKY